MRRKNILEKILPAGINIGIILVISFPLFIFLTRLEWTIATTVLFFAYHAFFLVCNDNRTMGMIILGDRWPERTDLRKSLLHIGLHTCIFGVFLYYVTTVL